MTRGADDRPVLALHGVTKVYAGPPPVPALRGVDLEVGWGELVAIVGPSGSGKSTLLHVMGALDRATTGLVVIDGTEVGDLTDRSLSALRAHRVGFVFQEFFLISGVTARDNVAQGLLYRGVPLSARRRAAERALERVGLGHRMNHRPHQLSGGERQRVAIARAVVGEPAIVFADEPTGNLDSATSAEVVDVLIGLQEAGSTIVVITHEEEVARRFPRVVGLRDGRVA